MNSGLASVCRRDWLVGTLALVGLGAGPRLETPGLEVIRARGRKARMEGFDESESANYVGIGDANKRFRADALKVCEAVATDYRQHFGDKGFKLAWPNEKLVVVILMGPKSYAMFEGEVLGNTIGGHFDLEQNHLVMFDFQGPGANPKATIPQQDNTLVLVHEAIHQLTFNTGLLDLKADIPLCVSEGLATYGETWTLQRKSGLGATNLRRRKGLEEGRKLGVGWIPLAKLIADDKLFEDEKTRQVAYAESWLFVHKMLKEPTRLPRFRDYLSALRERPDPASRVKVAADRLGDLDKLDAEIRTSR